MISVHEAWNEKEITDERAPREEACKFLFNEIKLLNRGVFINSIVGRHNVWGEIPVLG